MPDFSKMHNTKNAGSASEENETQACALAFQVVMLKTWDCVSFHI